MIRPSLAFGEEYEAFYFIAEYHALTVLRDPDEFVTSPTTSRLRGSRRGLNAVVAGDEEAAV
jgi:hypothetical protein